MADLDQIKKVFVPFIDEHPGHEFSHLQKRKHEVIPVTFLEKDTICRIQELEIGSSMPSASAVGNGEVYAKTAMMMCLPCWTLADLQSEQESESKVKYWPNFMEVIKENSALWKEGIEILHNIENRETAQKIKGVTETLLSKTKYEVTEDE